MAIVTVTIDRENGVTPLSIRCRQKAEDGKHNCTEWATCSFYNVDQDLIPEYEWYKPSPSEHLNSAEKDHVKSGGLLMRKIKR